MKKIQRSIIGSEGFYLIRKFLIRNLERFKNRKIGKNLWFLSVSESVKIKTVVEGWPEIGWWCWNFDGWKMALKNGETFFRTLYLASFLYFLPRCHRLTKPHQKPNSNTQNQIHSISASKFTLKKMQNLGIFSNNQDFSRYMDLCSGNRPLIWSGNFNFDSRIFILRIGNFSDL